LKFNSNITLQGNHGVKIDAKSGPITCSASADGSFKLTTGPIRAQVGEIPIRLAIPFLAGPAAMRTVAAIGAFGVRFDPCTVEVQAFGVRCQGVLAAEGMQCQLNVNLAGKTQVDLLGSIHGKLARVLLELADEDEVEPPAP
jgi:hypothetical protein